MVVVYHQTRTIMCTVFWLAWLTPFIFQRKFIFLSVYWQNKMSYDKITGDDVMVTFTTRYLVIIDYYFISFSRKCILPLRFNKK